MSDAAKAPPFRLYEEEMIPVPLETAKQLATYQSQMVEYLKILTSEERLEQSKTIIVQQALLTHAVDQLHSDLQQAGAKLETAVGKLNNAFFGLMKVPVAITIVGAASWAFLYSNKISESTWMAIMAVAVFPWVKESLEGVAKIWSTIRGGRGSDAK